MECEVCKEQVPQVVLHRINKKGSNGIWRCEEHITKKIDPGVKAITDIISENVSKETTNE